MYNADVGYSIRFDEKKNQLLKASRDVCFDGVVDAIEQNRLVGNIKHFKKDKYPNRYLFLVEVNNYIYIVPYLKDIKKKELYLKTVYPSRKFTKMYRRNNEKEK